MANGDDVRRFVDDLDCGQDRRVEPFQQTAAERYAAQTGKVEQLVDLGEIFGDRFLDEDGLAFIDGSFRPFDVRAGR